MSVSEKHSQKKVVGSRKTVKVGPWGGQGGSPWDDGSYSGVREITLVYDRCIDSIMILYDKNGKPVLGDKHGGSGGNLIVQVKLRYPEEFLTSVSGHYSPVIRGGSPVIRSLAFKSNQRTFGPFGVQEGTPFTLPMDGGMIVGFSGRCGWFLDAIGLSLSPIRTVGLYDTVQQKLQKFGNLATKTLGNRNWEHGSHATARTQKAHA